MEINDDQFLWTEKYRPKKIDDCVLPDATKNLAKALVEKGEITNLLFSGTAGTGKTTLAKAICDEIGCDYLYINCSKDNGIDTLRTKISTFASTMSLTGGVKVVIMDEADRISPAAMDALRILAISCTSLAEVTF